MTRADLGTYLLIVGLLLSAAPLTVATRFAALLRLNAARWVIPLYVGTLAVVIAYDLFLLGLGPPWPADGATSIPIGLAAGIVGIPVAWMIDRSILRAGRTFTERFGRRTRGAQRRDRGRARRPNNPLLVATGGGLEELIYRFYLPGLAAAVLGIGLGVGLSLVFYGLIHGVYGWWQVLAKGILGVFFLVLLAATGTLLAPCVAHAGFNLLATTTVRLRPRAGTRLRIEANVDPR